MQIGSGSTPHGLARAISGVAKTQSPTTTESAIPTTHNLYFMVLPLSAAPLVVIKRNTNRIINLRARMSSCQEGFFVVFLWSFWISAVFRNGLPTQTKTGLSGGVLCSAFSPSTQILHIVAGFLQYGA